MLLRSLLNTTYINMFSYRYPARATVMARPLRSSRQIFLLLWTGLCTLVVRIGYPFKDTTILAGKQVISALFIYKQRDN